MIGTMKQKKKQISDLAMDLEVINPIESKTVLGGDWYNTWWDNGDGITIEYGGGGGWYDPFGGTVDYSDDSYGNANQGWDYGSGGGGYSSDTGGHGLPNLPATVPLQLSTLGSCVSYTISFVSNYLGYTTNPLTTAAHVDAIDGLLPGTAWNQGLTPNQATWAIQGYFNTAQVNNVTQVNAALDANHAVIANYITDKPTPENHNTTTAHEVVIVEYNDWNYRIANSLTGNYDWIPKDSISFSNGVYEITGVHQ